MKMEVIVTIIQQLTNCYRVSIDYTLATKYRLATNYRLANKYRLANDYTEEYNNLSTC